MPDLSALAALHGRAMVAPPPWPEEAFRAALAHPAAFLVMAEGRAGPAGFILGRVIADEAEVLTLAVDPAAQRQGHGRALIGAFSAEATLRGAVTAFLEVAAGNRAAIGLYESCGFSRVGRRRAYARMPDGSYEDALVFRRLLGGDGRDGAGAVKS